MRIFDFFPRVTVCQSLHLITECNAVMLVRRILIFLKVTGQAKQTHCIIFFKNLIFLKIKHFLTFIRCHNFHERFIELGSDFLGDSQNSSRLPTSLILRHGFLGLMAVSEIQATLKGSHFENRNEIMQNATALPELFQAVEGAMG